MSSELAPIVQQWETAGTQLANALKVFLESCLSLEHSLLDPASAKRLSSKLDLQFEFLDTLATQQLFQVRASIGRMRNRVNPPVQRLPIELLCKVLQFSVNDIWARHSVNLKAGVVEIYTHINILDRVCSSWRDVILNQPEFWMLIPIIKDCKGQPLEDITQLCLQRSANSRNLYFAGDLDNSITPFLNSVFSKHAHRFQTLNLISPDLAILKNAITSWMAHSIPADVTELSICWTRDKDDFRWPRINNDSRIFPYESPQQASFNTFMESLHTLRLCGISTHPGTRTFRKLEHLRLDDVTLVAENAPMREFLLTVAPNLRTLYIIDSEAIVQPGGVDTPWSPDRSVDTDPNVTPILFPNLQTLCLRDLDPYMMKLLLCLVAPRSHRLIIHLGLRTIDTGELHQDLRPVLQGLNVSELHIGSVVGTAKLCPFIQLFPTITSLYLDAHRLNGHTLEALTASPAPHSASYGLIFPRLRELHLNNVIIEDQDAFKAMVSSHPLERLRLGGYLCDPKYLPGGISPWVSHRIRLEPSSELGGWLQSAVPSFSMHDPDHTLTEFLPTGWETWQLW